MLRSGNANGNRNIKALGLLNDKDAVLSKVGVTTSSVIIPGYNREDLNLDGLVKYLGLSNDATIIDAAVGAATLNVIIAEQTPN